MQRTREKDCPSIRTSMSIKPHTMRISSGWPAIPPASTFPVLFIPSFTAKEGEEFLFPNLFVRTVAIQVVYASWGPPVRNTHSTFASNGVQTKWFPRHHQDRHFWQRFSSPKKLLFPSWSRIKSSSRSSMNRWCLCQQNITSWFQTDMRTKRMAKHIESEPNIKLCDVWIDD